MAGSSKSLASKFPGRRYVGDKRTQRVYDLESATGNQNTNTAENTTLAELLESEQFICFAPDTLAEARNRGYRPT